MNKKIIADELVKTAKELTAFLDNKMVLFDKYGEATLAINLKNTHGMIDLHKIEKILKEDAKKIADDLKTGDSTIFYPFFVLEGSRFHAPVMLKTIDNIDKSVTEEQFYKIAKKYGYQKI